MFNFFLSANESCHRGDGGGGNKQRLVVAVAEAAMAAVVAAEAAMAAVAAVAAVAAAGATVAAVAAAGAAEERCWLRSSREEPAEAAAGRRGS